jgi:hypothetical protein
VLRVGRWLSEVLRKKRSEWMKMGVENEMYQVEKRDLVRL